MFGQTLHIEHVDYWDADNIDYEARSCERECAS